MQQLTIAILLYLGVSALGQAPPTPVPELVINSVTGGVELTLATELNVEYTLQHSTSLSDWQPLGETLLGNSLLRTIAQPAPAPARLFLRVQADTEFEIDAETFGYGEPGRTWVYAFTQTVQNDGQVVRQDDYDQTRIITGPAERNGISAYDITDYDESGTEVFINYVSANFSDGVFFVGSRDPSAFFQESFNNPPAPEIMSTFTPGVEQESTSTNTVLGASQTVLQISIHPGSLTVPAGTFQEVIYVNRINTGMTILGSVRDVTQSWWVRGIGPIKLERDTTLNDSEEPNIIQRFVMKSVIPG